MSFFSATKIYFARKELTHSKVVDIVFISDRRYIDILKTALYTLVNSKKPNTQYAVHLILMTPEKDQIEELKLFSRDDVSIDIMKKEMLPLPFPDTDFHVSRASLSKFFLPDYFPEKDKILYLDADIIVQGDLTELFETDIGDKYLGAVRLFSELLGTRRWFNAGVMLMNLKKMREENLPERLYETRKKYNSTTSMDELTFNKVIGMRGYYQLPWKFNTMTHVFIQKYLDESRNKMDKEYAALPANLYDIYHNAVIIHLIKQNPFGPKIWERQTLPDDTELKHHMWLLWKLKSSEAAAFLKTRSAATSHKTP